jgi:hypothetical protein
LFVFRSNEQLGQAQSRMAELEQLLAASNAALATAQVWLMLNAATATSSS